MAIVAAVRSWLPFCYYFYFYALPERRNLPLDGVHPRIQELTFYSFTVRVPTSVLTQRAFNERILVFLSRFLARRFGDGVSRASRKARRRLYSTRLGATLSPPPRLYSPFHLSTRSTLRTFGLLVRTSRAMAPIGRCNRRETRNASCRAPRSQSPRTRSTHPCSP